MAPGSPAVPSTGSADQDARGSSDAYLRREPGARFRYRDEGKRYDFELVNGVVTAVHPDGTRTTLMTARSYERTRQGENTPAPPFDLIAANGGRVFAKVRGTDRFYFTTMDHMFLQAAPGGGEIPVPSTFFKLDPEFNQPTANVTHLTRHLAGCFADHPAAERFPLFRVLLEQELFDLMVVALEPRVWHHIDARPRLAELNLKLMAIDLVGPTMVSMLPQDLRDTLIASFRTATAMEAAPPEGYPRYPHSSVCREVSTVTMPSIDFRKVLDIGVGHVHWHEQYESVTGGELQPLRTGRILPEPWPPIGYAELYRAVNGPVRDGDGYIDGTCNFYLLVQLQDGRYALLYLDEQMYFTQRWRLCSPDDHAGGGLALVVALNEDLTRDPPLYNWRRDTFWDPFTSGHIGPRSRLAVSRQVLLVTGEDPASKEARIYSINFSHGTMDRTWRWRSLPARAVTIDEESAAGTEPSVPLDDGDCALPQTIRLREDMTIHLRGARCMEDGSTVSGRWYQRYLPCDNRLVPPAHALVPNRMPAEGYAHRWKFLPEAVFQRADRFSQIGVYDAVDSRTQYYLLEQPSAATEQLLADGSTGPWVDVEHRLSIRAWKFWWAAPLRTPAAERWVPTDDPDNSLSGFGVRPPQKRPPSLFNSETRLRIVRRGSRWIAMHLDKRDDDLMPFDDLPRTVRLRNGDRIVDVTLQANVFLESPPAVTRAHFWWEPTGEAALAFLSPAPSARIRDTIWRVRVAALKPDAASPSRIGQVVWLVDAEREGRFTLGAGGLHQYRWVPTASERAMFTEYCSPAGEAAYGTSIWFEDVTGRVSVPEEVRWNSPLMRVTVTPELIPFGLPVQVTVHAEEASSSAALVGTVVIDGQPVGQTDYPLVQTFRPRQVRTIDPDTRAPILEMVEPSGVVSVEGYLDASIPFAFYLPMLNVTVEPARLPIGQPVRLTVRATDATTNVAVAGQVSIGGQHIGSTNVPLTHTFSAGQTSATVTAAGYPSRSVAVSLYELVSDAAFVGQSVPTVMVTGERYSVSVRMRNTGTTTWTPEGSNPYRLGSQIPQDTTVWGTNRVDLAAPVAPGAEATFAFTVTAPPPGTHRFQWQMVQELVRWFGARTPDTAVQVIVPTIQASVTPFPVPLNQAVQVTVRANRNPGGATVVGDVLVNGTRVAATNTPFTYTLRMRIVGRTYDPVIRRTVPELGPPEVIVRAPGYSDASVDVGL